MKKIHLIWIIPLCLLFGIMLGFYIAIPEKIEIDLGNNFVESMALVNSSYYNLGEACKNLTYECNCIFPGEHND